MAVRIRATYFSLTVGPKVGSHANNVVQSGVGALVDQECTQRAQGVDDQARLDGSMESSAGKKW